MGGGSSTMIMWRTDMFEIGRKNNQDDDLDSLCFLIRMMSPTGSQPNLSKCFTELSFIVFSICSKVYTSTGSSIPREAAVTCARVGSISIITCRTAVTLVTWGTFVDIWSKKKIVFTKVSRNSKYRRTVWSFWHISPINIQESLSIWIPGSFSLPNKI